MTRLASLITIFLALTNMALADPKYKVVGPVYKNEHGQATPMSKEETACHLMIFRASLETRVCEQRHASQTGLSIDDCHTLAAASTQQCEVYARSKVREVTPFEHCIKAADRLMKCAMVLRSGCEYTAALASKLESVSGMTNHVPFIANALKEECPRPNSRRMVDRARHGTLWVLARSPEQHTPLAPIAPLVPVTPVADQIPVSPSKLEAAKRHYTKVCFACHDLGTIRAPRLDQSDEWYLRLRQPTEILYQHSLEGFNACPPRGGAAFLSVQDVKGIVDYMVSRVEKR